MKINLIYDEKLALNGYLNILNRMPNAELVPGAYKENRVLYCSPAEFSRTTSYDDFGDIVFDGEADEVLVQYLTDYIEPLKVDAHINKWCSLLAVGGVISITGTDILQVADALNMGRISVQEANVYLYGGELQLTNGITIDGGAKDKKAIYTTQVIESVLKDNGVITERIVVDKYNYCITGRKTRVN